MNTPDNTTTLSRCPKGNRPKMSTRESPGRWFAMGFKTLKCPCDCLRATVSYVKGGKSWQKAEAQAIAEWNAEVKNHAALRKRL